MKLWGTSEKCLAQRFIRRLCFCIILLISYFIVQQQLEIISNSNVKRFTLPNDLIVEYIEGNNARTEINTATYNRNTNITNDRPIPDDGRTINLKGTLGGVTTAQSNSSNNIKGKYPETKASECAKQLHVIGGINQLKQSKKVKIGILIPSCTRKLKKTYSKKPELNNYMPTVTLQNL